MEAVVSTLTALVIAAAIFVILIVGVIAWCIAMMLDDWMDRAWLLVGFSGLVAVTAIFTIARLQ